MAAVYVDDPSGCAESPPQPLADSGQLKDSAGSVPDDTKMRTDGSPASDTYELPEPEASGPQLRRLPLFAAAWSQCGRAIRTR